MADMALVDRWCAKTGTSYQVIPGSEFGSPLMKFKDRDEFGGFYFCVETMPRRSTAGGGEVANKIISSIEAARESQRHFREEFFKRKKR